MSTVNPNACKAMGCIENAQVIYCEKHMKIRLQHAVSHKMEGHSNPIEFCARCEDERDANQPL